MERKVNREHLDKAKEILNIKGNCDEEYELFLIDVTNLATALAEAEEKGRQEIHNKVIPEYMRNVRKATIEECIMILKELAPDSLLRNRIEKKLQETKK